MITLNGVKFAQNDDEFINSLFENGGTCDGYYRVNKKSITLMDKDKNKIGVICNMVLGKATKLDNGKWWYSYGKPELIGEYDSYVQEQDELNTVYKKYPMPIIY